MKRKKFKEKIGGENADFLQLGFENAEDHTIYLRSVFRHEFIFQIKITLH